MNANLHLPPIRLEDLPGKTKDFILAYCNQNNCTPAVALRLLLNNAAARAGFAVPANSTGGAQGDLAMQG